MKRAEPFHFPSSLIVSVVEACQRNWPHLGPPMFHGDDVMQLLAGDDREHAAACVLIEADRVFYPHEGES
jgi:hypothetical protein